MEVFSDIRKLDIDSSVVCVGTFDGLHLGHKVVIDQTIKQAQKLNAKSVVFTFWPHPQEIIFPDKDVYYLSTYQEKIELFEKSGIDYLILYSFDKHFSSKTYQSFIKEFLVDQLKMKFFIIGYDHQFGKEREGNYNKMLEYAKAMDFGIERVEQQAVSNEFISSTKIRELLKSGCLEDANRLLGYTYFTSGEVIKGQRIGRTIGFPTANIKISANKIIPKSGVYIVEIIVDKQTYRGVANIGFKPTVNNHNNRLTLEVHLFKFKADLYTKNIKILFYKRIRAEIKFASIETLKIQIEKDKNLALEYFKINNL